MPEAVTAQAGRNDHSRSRPHSLADEGSHQALVCSRRAGKERGRVTDGSLSYLLAKRARANRVWRLNCKGGSTWPMTATGRLVSPTTLTVGMSRNSLFLTHILGQNVVFTLSIEDVLGRGKET